MRSGEVYIQDKFPKWLFVVAILMLIVGALLIRFCSFEWKILGWIIFILGSVISFYGYLIGTSAGEEPEQDHTT